MVTILVGVIYEPAVSVLDRHSLPVPISPFHFAPDVLKIVKSWYCGFRRLGFGIIKVKENENDNAAPLPGSDDLIDDLRKQLPSSAR